MFLEKMFAKVNVNYELSNGASMIETWDFLLGVPVVEYSMTTQFAYASNDATTIPNSAADVWTMVSAGIKKGDLFGAKTLGAPTSGLVSSTYYSIIGAFQVITTATFNLL